MHTQMFSMLWISELRIADLKVKRLRGLTGDLWCLSAFSFTIILLAIWESFLFLFCLANQSQCSVTNKQKAYLFACEKKNIKYL